MSGIRIYYRPGSTRGVLLELAGVENALVDVRTRQDISSPHSPASDKESSEAHTGDSATSPSNNESANVEKQPVATGKYRRMSGDESSHDGNFTRDFGDESSSRQPKTSLRNLEQPEVMRRHGKRMDDHSPYGENVSRHFGYTGTEIAPEDPIEVDWKSSISKYAERPWDLRKIEISPRKQKLGTLMYTGNALRHKRWVTPIQRIETLTPSYPDRLSSLITPVFAGCEHPSLQHPSATAGSEKRCLPPQMTAVFTDHSPTPTEGLWTYIGNGRKMCWRVPQMKTFLDSWDQYWEHVTNKADKDKDILFPYTKDWYWDQITREAANDNDNDETFLEAQDWCWEEPYEEWDSDIDGHTNDPTTVSGVSS